MESSEVRAILQAAERGDKKTLQSFIAEGKVGVVDEDGNTPLMYAAASGREEVLRMLLDKDCLGTNQLEKEGEVRYIDLQNRYGWTALMQSCCYGHSGAVVLLLQRAADVQLCNAWKASSLVVASQGGHFGIVHTLLNHGAKVDLDTEDLLCCTLTPLMAAAQCGHVEVVEELIRGGAKLEMKLQATEWTPLMFAVLNNKPEVVDLLLKSGADKEVKDIQGKMAVELASSLGHYNVVRLLARGILTRNVSFSDNEFFEVVNKGNVEKVQEMLALKPSMAAIEDKDGATPLMYASNKGHKDVCEVLLEAKAEVNIKDKKYGWTALMHATHNTKYEIVELLGKYGADVNVRGKTGSTAYDIASMKGDIKMIKLIANITVERIKNKATPTEASPITKAHTPSITVLDTPTSDNPASQSSLTRKPQPIDLSELRSRLQKAYLTPTPKIAVSGNDSALSPSATPRFPSARNPRPSTLSSSTHNSTPSNNLRPSMGVKGLASPSKSAGSFPSNKIPSKQQAPPTSHSPFPRVSSAPGVGAGPPGARSRVASLGFGSADKADDRTKYRLKSPLRAPSTFEGGHMTRVKAPPTSPFSTSAKNLSHKKTSVEGWNVGVPRGAVARGGAIRKRANTEPTSPTSQLSWMNGRGRGRGNLKQTDLKSVLEEASMAKYYSVFQEQEVDYDSFVGLTSGDLAEMGITDEQARGHLMALITQLNTNTGTSSMNNSDVFVFH